MGRQNSSINLLKIEVERTDQGTLDFSLHTDFLGIAHSYIEILYKTHRA